MKYYVVKYAGQFGFIKPWTAVRDSETFSQQFLTPSIIEGIEKKLFPELLNKKGIHKIIRHRVSYVGVSRQQEVTQIRGINIKKKDNRIERPRSILTRGILLNPNLYLAFSNELDADSAFKQHICLCRNEDILLPIEKLEITKEVFDSIKGFELHFQETENAFLVGYNRFNHAQEMYGWLEINEG